MGLLAQRLEQRYEARNDPGWLTRGDTDDGQLSSAGIVVSPRNAFSLTTFWRCVDLLSSAVSQAPKDIIVKIGERGFPQFQKPTWLESPAGPTNPTYTVNDYFADVAVSMLIDGNYFTHVFPNVLDPQILTLLPPGRVTIKPGPTYEVRDASGRVVNTLEPLEMLHGTWLRMPGDPRGISPLEFLRRSIGAAIAAEDFAARYFGQGASLAFGVEVPGTLNPAQKADLAESLRKKHSGTANSHAIGILTGGAKFIGNLAPTAEQAQMLATRQFSVEEGCRPFGIPPHMVGSQQPGAVSYASVNGTLLEFKQYAVLPLALRIEAQHNRLVQVPSGINAPNATAQFKFNLDGIARADLLTRIQAYSQAILSGQITPDESRALEDRAPVGGNASKLLMQRQMVPIDDLGTASPVPGMPADAALVADKVAPLGPGEKQPANPVVPALKMPGG